uniref:Translation initiation factor 1 n=3 Tax=Phormium TaxID=51474 RepID=A0A8K1VPV4_9ASPA|nr:translation initiation factor 1 [Phormium tenax]UER97344.1 translation initiation factor 1 [Phormium cookianum]UER98885.1 translation initiation factor 1 [Phormium cookianum x Phormium tenax]UER97430.1 translation initiation factor 1 [Phormium tenax]UER97516.1 translation initiation factor 1 [Phormium tenax]
MKEQKLIHEGLITESLPIGYISGRIRRSSIRILPGDRVKIEISRFNRGRLIYRLRNKDSND